MKAYLASHFFNKAGFDYTEKIASVIRSNFPSLDLYVPQENGEINDKEKNDDTITAELISEGDNKYLRESNILIANIDGVEIDSGVSAEIGYFSAIIELEKKFMDNPKPRAIIGLYTDIRQNGTGENFFYINLYTKGLIKTHGRLVKDEKELIDALKLYVK